VVADASACRADQLIVWPTPMTLPSRSLNQTARSARPLLG
jgi:hypothetical protein